MVTKVFRHPDLSDAVGPIARSLPVRTAVPTDELTFAELATGHETMIQNGSGQQVRDALRAARHDVPLCVRTCIRGRPLLIPMSKRIKHPTD